METAPPPRGVAADGVPLPPGAVARIGTGRFHVDSPYRAALTPDGRSLLVGGRILDSTSGLEIGRVPVILADGAVVRGSVISPDSRSVILLVDRQGANAAWPGVVVWDIATRTERRAFALKKMGLPGSVVSASGDGSRLLCLDAYRSMVLWTDLDTDPKSVPLGKTEGGSWYDGPRITTDGQFVIDVGPKVRLWDAATGKLAREFDGPKGQTVRWAVSPDGKQFAAISGPSIPTDQDKGETTYRVSQWDLAAGRETRQLTERLTTRAVRSGDTLRLLFTPDGGSVVVLDDDGAKQQYLVRRWAVADGLASPEWAIPMSRGYGNLPLLAPDGKTLYHVSLSGVRTFDLEKGIETSPADLRAGGDYPLGFAADGKNVVTRRGAGRIAIWETETGRLVREEKIPAIEKVFNEHFTSDARLVAVDTTVGPKNDRDTVVYDRASGRELYRLCGERCGTFSPDGKHLFTLSADMKTAIVYDAESGKLHRRIPCTGDDSFFFSPDGSTFSRPWRTSTQVHDATTGELVFDGKDVLPEHLKPYPLGSGGPHPRVPFSDSVFASAIGPGGKRFAVVATRSWYVEKRPSLDRVIAFDAAGKKLLWEAELEAGRYRDFSATAAVFSPDGAILAVGGRRAVTLFDAASGKPLRRYEGHSGTVIHLRFAPNGKRLLATDHDGTVWVWDTDVR